MLKKILGIIVAAILVIPSYASGTIEDTKGYESELAAQKERLEKLSKEIEALKDKLKEIKLEYIDAEKELHKGIVEKTASLVKAEEERNRKAILRGSKERQAGLRRLYYQKKRPFAEEMHKLKLGHNQCAHKIKELEKIIQEVKEGKGPDSEYIRQINVLKQELTELRDKHKEALAKLHKETDAEIAKLIDRENRARPRNDILTEARGKELQMQQEYSKAKEFIGTKIDKAKAEHRERIRQRRELRQKEQKKAKKQEQTVQGEDPRCNFCPARN